ncbi:nucleotide-binding domain-containing protein [Rickenella mellea]|uniref:Nucleotide-binding domain-containing protein n=1 Tax=Rickenella mellea TaxID=50990 RepID=A0A4Y7Q2V7_9AGAM|nr:nucleotide-binding domain-containing protein [Rickenella mellea]
MLQLSGLRRLRLSAYLGVVGLSTALKIQERGYSVTIIAETLPSDPKTIRYTSHWAGAHHVSIAGDDVRQQKMDRETFRIMWDMSGNEAEGCFLRIPQTEFYCEERKQANILEVMPDFRYLGATELLAGSKSGVSFTTLTIDSPVYLNYLLSLFLSRGGRVQRAAIQHISQVAEGAFCRAPNAIVICAGMGARTLGGVEDKDVYPIRGQTVLLRAPWIRFGVTQSSLDGLWTYVIPRRSGDVIVGGTKIDNDWYPNPRPETTADILSRALTLCPELAPPFLSQDGQTIRNPNPTVEDLQPIIIESGCGLRPARKGGIRLETEQHETISGNVVQIVHNYGHGGYGYQSSWGSANIAVALLDGVLKEVKANPET